MREKLWYNSFNFRRNTRKPLKRRKKETDAIQYFPAFRVCLQQASPRRRIFVDFRASARFFRPKQRLDETRKRPRRDKKTAEQTPIPLLAGTVCLQRQYLQYMDARLAKGKWRSDEEADIYRNQRGPIAEAMIETITIYQRRTGKTFDPALCQPNAIAEKAIITDSSPALLQTHICGLIMARQARQAAVDVRKLPGAPDAVSIKKLEAEVAQFDREIKLTTADFRNKTGKPPNTDGCSDRLKPYVNPLDPVKTAESGDQPNEAASNHWFKQAGFYFMYEPTIIDPKDGEGIGWHYYVGIVIERNDGSFVFQVVSLTADDPGDVASLKKAYQTGLYKRIVPGFEADFYIVTDHQVFAETTRAAEAAAAGNVCLMPFQMLAVPLTFGLSKPCSLAAVRGWTAIEKKLGGK